MFTIFEKLLRLLAAFIDGLLGWAAGELYKLIVQIANVDIFGNYIYEFMGRIYTYLAIFMLFKLSISVVNYVLNPDMLVDKSKGFGKIIQNVIIVIGLIIMTPQIFDWAYKLQSTILNTNVLYTIITGKKNESTYDPQKYANMTDDSELVAAITSDAEYAANMIKYEIMSAFIYNENNNENSAVKGKTGKTCYEFIEGGSNYRAGYDCLMSLETVNNTDNRGSKTYGFSGDFTNEYKAFISTACIGVVAYVFLVTAFDIALRCVKLGALQLMAPIPIISMLDPDSAKNGMFSKWFKECKNVYLSLFTRLIAIYFAVEIIKSMSESGRFVWRGTNTNVGFGFVKIFIILGLLMFAKQFPQFIESTLGIKMDTGGLNLKKKLESVPGLNKTIGATKGLATGAAIGAVGAFTGAGALRGLSGAWQGMRAGMQGKKFGEIRKGQVDVNRKMRNAIENGSTFQGRMSARMRSAVGIDTRADDREKRAKEIGESKKFYDSAAKLKGDINDRIISEMESGKDLSGNGTTWITQQKNLLRAKANKDLVAQVEGARMQKATQDFEAGIIDAATLNSIKSSAAQNMSDAEMAYASAKDTAYKEVINSGEAINDGYIKSKQTDFNNSVTYHQEDADRAGISQVDLSVRGDNAGAVGGVKSSASTWSQIASNMTSALTESEVAKADVANRDVTK